MGNGDYSSAQVLQTPKQSGTPLPKECGFFTSIIYFMVGRETNTTLEREISSPIFARFEAPGHPAYCSGQLPSKELGKMKTQSKVTSPRRKTKLVASHQAVQLTPAMIDRHARSQALNEILEFMKNWTDAERSIVGHLSPFGDPVAGMKEIRRMLGESIAQCKVIPFPVGGKRGLLIAKEA